MKSEVLRMDNVTYYSDGVMQLHCFNFQIFRGEVMGLVPLNAHGVESLLTLLRQNLPIHFGRIYFCENLVNSHIYRRAEQNAAAVIGHKSCLVEGLTVGDNLFVLGQRKQRWIIRPQRLRRQLQQLEQKMGVELPADSYVEDLTFFQRCLAELFKAVMARCALIIMQDVSHYLDAGEVKRLHAVVRALAEEGISFLYISNDCGEIAGICDRSAVMQNGEIVKVFQSGLCNEELLSKFIRSPGGSFSEKQARREPGKACFRIEHLCSNGIEDLNLSLCPGECLVLHAADESLLMEFRQLMKGEEQPTRGTVYLGEKRARKPLVQLPQFAYLSENPSSSILFFNLDYMANLTFSLKGRNYPLLKRPAIFRSIRCELGEELGNAFDTDVEELDVEKRYTLLLHRIMLQRPYVVVWERPLFGADLILCQHILSVIERLQERQIAVMILTTGFYKTFPLADRVLELPRAVRGVQTPARQDGMQ